MQTLRVYQLSTPSTLNINYVFSNPNSRDNISFVYIFAVHLKLDFFIIHLKVSWYM